MKSLFQIGLSILSCSILMVSCGKEKPLLLDEVGGEEFLFPSPITAIVDAGDSLLVGTSDGRISYFNINNGDRSEFRAVTGGAIYDMEICGDYLYYSVQDGGVRRINLKRPNEKPVCFQIMYKLSYYSPYDILITDDGNALFGATSNGFYRWDTREPDRYADTIESLPKAAPHRFFSVTKDSSNAVIFAGEPGVFKYDGKVLKEINKSSTRALHSGYQLSEDSRFSTGYGQPDGYISCFKRNPRNFAVQDSFVYAVSERAIEILNLSDNKTMVVNLPEKHLNRARNKSTRAVCVLKGAFVYAAPGGNKLYKLPAKHYGSEEIVSICQKDGNELYALSANNDLYSISINKDNGGKPVLSHARYVRTIPVGNQVRLLAASGNAVFVYKDTLIYRLEGKRRKCILDTPHPLKAGNATCNSVCGETLFQGRTDYIRSYTYSHGWKKSASTKDYSLSHGLNVRNSQLDYYPRQIAKIGDNIVFGTLHNGVYSVDVTAEDLEYKCLIDTLSVPDVKAIESFEDAAFVLTADSLYRFCFAEDKIIPDGPWAIEQFGANARSYDRILPVATDSIFIYSDDHDFCRGAFGYTLNNDVWEPTDSISLSSSINDAVFMKEIQIPVFCGSMGVCLIDEGTVLAVNRPTHYTLQKIHAQTYCWGLVSVIFASLLILGLIIYSIIASRKNRFEKEIKRLGDKNLKFAHDLEKQSRKTIPELTSIIDGAREAIKNLHLYDVSMRLNRIIDQASTDIELIRGQEEKELFHQSAREFRVWTLENFHSGYVLKLAEELISLSNSTSELTANILKFKNDVEKLTILDSIGNIINEVKSIVTHKLMADEPRVDNESDRKEQLDKDYSEKVTEFFKFYETEDKDSSEWGKVFKNAVDKKRPSTYKLSFMFFPLSVKDAEGEWLPTMFGSFPTRKSEWKNGGRPPYCLLNFMNTNEYGLFRLIAGAGLRNLENKQKEL